ncbi:hypothetical protein KO317_01720 [Candidatus Micrarchaeota archaeon]|jgi:selenocysteine-specific translation elongation factor|nr:hypothetical protein [Candidatus Micrarchaeota archaeon]
MGWLDRIKGVNSSEKTEILEIEENIVPDRNKFIVDEVYTVQGFPVVRGRVLSGTITKESFTRINEKTCNVAKIQADRKELQQVSRGEQCSMILTQVNQHSLRENQVLEFF